MGKTGKQRKARDGGAAFVARAALAERLGVSPDFLWRRAAAGKALWAPGPAGYHREQAAIIEAVLAGAFTEGQGAELWEAQKTLLRAACAGAAVNAPAPRAYYGKPPAAGKRRRPAAS